MIRPPTSIPKWEEASCRPALPAAASSWPEARGSPSPLQALGELAWSPSGPAAPTLGLSCAPSGPGFLPPLRGVISSTFLLGVLVQGWEAQGPAIAAGIPSILSTSLAGSRLSLLKGPRVIGNKSQECGGAPGACDSVWPGSRNPTGMLESWRVTRTCPCGRRGCAGRIAHVGVSSLWPRGRKINSSGIRTPARLSSPRRGQQAGRAGSAGGHLGFRCGP